jgi:hypothetical protein
MYKYKIIYTHHIPLIYLPFRFIAQLWRKRFTLKINQSPQMVLCGPFIYSFKLKNNVFDNGPFFSESCSAHSSPCRRPSQGYAAEAYHDKFYLPLTLYSRQERFGTLVIYSSILGTWGFAIEAPHRKTTFRRCFSLSITTSIPSHECGFT